jgi:TonB family protein
VAAPQGGALENLMCLLLGAGTTFGLFLGVALFESVKTEAPRAEIEDVHTAAAIYVPPPPKPEEQVVEQPDLAPLAGIDIGASDSPVKLSVIPPDLQKILPTEALPPRATIQFGQIMTELKPRVGISADFQHVYQSSEVDVPAKAIVQPIAKVPSRIHEGVDQLRVVLWFVVETDGTVTGMRIVKSSGNSEFDEIVSQCIQEEWQFSAAVKKGHKVRQLVQQPVWYKWTSGSKFTI